MPEHDYIEELGLKYDTLTPINTYDLFRPKNAAYLNDDKRYWLIYLPGGAWRDPRQISRGIIPALSYLSPAEHAIAGIISVNYRLSEYPDDEEDPSSPDDPSRNAVHPDHIEDVLTALKFLQRKYRLGHRYILSGHSAGATLSFQAVMGVWKPRKGIDEGEDQTSQLEVEPPIAIVGVAGIYDLKLFLDNHIDSPFYRAFLEAAFGKNIDLWSSASPVFHKSLRETWPSGRVTVIVHSKEDVLVDWPQAEKMSDYLWKEKSPTRRDAVIEVKGGHDELWEVGKGLSESLIKALEMLKNI